MLTISDIILIAIICNLYNCTVELLAWVLCQCLNAWRVSNDCKGPPQHISKPTNLPPPPPTMVPPPKKTGQEIHIRNK